MAKPTKERRQHPRAKGVPGLTVGAGSETPNVQVEDLSLSGLCFRTSRPIEYMTRLTMTLVFSPRHSPADRSNKPVSVQCEGAVVRCDPFHKDNGTQYEVAVFFTDLDETAEEAIGEYVSTHG